MLTREISLAEALMEIQGMCDFIDSQSRDGSWSTERLDDIYEVAEKALTKWENTNKELEE